MTAGRRATRALFAFVLSCVASAGRPLPAQTVPVRFEVAAVADSMVTIPLLGTRNAKWVRPGMDGIVVDATRRDALVASIRIVAVTSTEATGVVTGQTTRVEPGHIAILNRRSRAWFARGSFWAGMILGAIVGGIIGAQ